MHKPTDVEIFDNAETNSSHIEWRCEDCEDDPNYPCDALLRRGLSAGPGGKGPRMSVWAALKRILRVQFTHPPHPPIPYRTTK